MARASLTDVGLPLVEPPVDGDPATLPEVLGDALGEAAEAHDIDVDRAAVLAQEA
ncbi:MAG: hypothetical protein M3417_08450 [Actinomycetota bacterium]|nr:hypothetical protein [Actinomycetota bacterium]